MDRFGRPADIGECYEYYIGIVKHEVAKMGIDRDNIDDVAHDLILKFWDKGYIEKYNPDVDQYGVPWPANRRPKFQTLLRRFVRMFGRQDMEKQKNARKREPIRFEAPAYMGESGPVAWLEVIGGEPSVADTRTELRDLLRWGYEGLKNIPSEGRKDLARVFEVMVGLWEQDGKIDRREVAKTLGVSPSIAGEWMREVRLELALDGVMPS